MLHQGPADGIMGAERMGTEPRERTSTATPMPLPSRRSSTPASTVTSSTRATTSLPSSRRMSTSRTSSPQAVKNVVAQSLELKTLVPSTSTSACSTTPRGHNYLHGSCLLTWIILLHCNHQLTKSFGPVASRYSFLCTFANSLPILSDKMYGSI